MSNSEFDGYLQDFSVVDTVGDGSDDAGGDQQFSATLRNVDILEFRERVGAADSLPPDPSELAYFMLLFTLDIITRLDHETNLYAEQCQAARGVRDSAWQPTTVEEMRAYIAVNILIGFNQLPEIDHYWSSDDMLGVHAQ